MDHRRQRRLYMGVDISEGSPQSSTRAPRYSVAVIDEEGRLVEKQDSVSLARLIRLAWYYKPARIAFDNVLEIAPSRRGLERVLELFPPDSEIVQATLTDRGLVGLEKLAAEHVGEHRGKPRPGRAAYLLAVLAWKGVGTPVRRVEQKTRIIVTRTRMPKGGGFSQARYRRRVRASVLNAAMRVKEALDNAGLEYDFNYRRSEGGLESAVFTVYAPRERLRGVVRPHRGVDYSIIVRPEYRVSLAIPGAGEERPSRPVIVGIDPGVTTGIAVIDLHGRVLYLGSGKGLDRGSIAEIVTRLGRPVIVAVDVPSPPETVRKIAAMLGASLYTPGEELSVAQKRALASRALGGRHPEDSHQRDALAAAYRAYTLLQGKLDHVESQVRRLGLEVDVQRIKEAVIRGLTVAEALEEAISERLEEIEGAHAPRESRGAGQRCPGRGLAERIESLEAEVRLLRESLREARLENERLREELERRLARARSEAYRDALVARLESELEALQRVVDRLRSEQAGLREENRRLARLLLELWRGEAGPAARVSSVTARNLRRAQEALGALAGEAVYADNPSYDRAGLELASESRILGVLVPESPGWEGLAGAARRLGVAVVPVSREEILYEARDFVVVSRSAVDRLEEARESIERERLSRLSLERLISDYRASRRKELRRA